MLERSGIISGMNKLDSAKRCQVLKALVEGCSVNSTARLTDVSVPSGPASTRGAPLPPASAADPHRPPGL